MSDEPEVTKKATEDKDDLVFEATPAIIALMVEKGRQRRAAMKEGDILHDKLWKAIGEVYPETLEGNWIYNKTSHTITKSEERESIGDALQGLFKQFN